jgi:hypothetical protein
MCRAAPRVRAAALPAIMEALTVEVSVMEVPEVSGAAPRVMAVVVARGRAITTAWAMDRSPQTIAALTREARTRPIPVAAMAEEAAAAMAMAMADEAATVEAMGMGEDTAGTRRC